MIKSPENNRNSNSSLISKQINLSEIPSTPINLTKTEKEKEDNDIENNFSDLLSILKEIPLHNLNDYYNIETNVFKKRIEKLNLQFFWIYESILEGQNINITDNNNNMIIIIINNH